MLARSIIRAGFLAHPRVDAVRGLCQVYSLNGCFITIERQTAMSQLQAAQQHLAEALRRLEYALAHRLAQVGSGAPADYERRLAALTAERNDLARDVGMLRGECDRLSAALSETQRDHRNLRDVTAHVARRIDGSIAEIDRLLEG
jgi:predicted  nucleic acid-binding Zn-ribbon protein